MTATTAGSNVRPHPPCSRGSAAAAHGLRTLTFGSTPAEGGPHGSPHTAPCSQQDDQDGDADHQDDRGPHRVNWTVTT